MKKLITQSILAVLAATMLLPVTLQVNAASVNQASLRQGPPIPPSGSGGGGHFSLRQGPPIPPSGSGGGGHFSLRQGPPIPPSGSGGGGH
jgi:hypothetical protein